MLETMKRYWGYESFRPMQQEIVSEALAGRDTLAILPTGGGKSLCFQLPAMMKEGICIVVSPLIALMKDQLQNLRERGILAQAGARYEAAVGILKDYDNEWDAAIDNWHRRIEETSRKSLFRAGRFISSVG